MEPIAVAYLLAYVLEKVVDDGSASSISLTKEFLSYVNGASRVSLTMESSIEVGDVGLFSIELVVCVNDSCVTLAIGTSAEVDDVGLFSIASSLGGEPASAASDSLPVYFAFPSSALLL